MNFSPLFATLPDWAPLAAEIDNRLSVSNHGDFDKWQTALSTLPDVIVERVDIGATVAVVAADGTIAPDDIEALREALMALHPWRKGPFDLFGVKIDSEWRSDWKWQRAAPHLTNLRGAQVLDVGCGNGYFGWRALAAGASLVAGVDPTLVFFFQHQAINRYIESSRNWLLPLTFEELPQIEFDTVLSMGVIYHRRDPLAHTKRLFGFTRPGGEVLLESLVVADPNGMAPGGRYARMRNLWLIPSTQLLCRWLEDAGFVDVASVDATTTTLEEQRRTQWMKFESLAEALDPADITRTVEGHPAPVRAIVVGRRPS